MVGFGSRTAKRPRDRLARLENGERLSLPHGRRDGIDHRHRNSISDLVRQAGQRRAGQNDDIGVVLFDREVRQSHQHVFLLGLDIRDGLKGFVERADAGAARLQPVHGDAFLIPGRERAAKTSRWKIAARACRRSASPLRQGRRPEIENSSRAPNRPGSPNAAMIAASKPEPASASISSAIAPPICASARVAM